jgi:hypothetical protein
MEFWSITPGLLSFAICIEGSVRRAGASPSGSEQRNPGPGATF